MLPDDFGENEFAMIEKFFTENYPEIRAAVREDIQDVWGSLPDGPFNTDPVIEPRLKVLSERPEYTIEDSTITEDGRLSLFITFRCDATIRCKKYQDNGDDLPLSTTKIMGGVTYEIPINLTIDIESGEIEDFEICDLAWKKWPNWPN